MVTTIPKVTFELKTDYKTILFPVSLQVFMTLAGFLLRSKKQNLSGGRAVYTLL